METPNDRKITLQDLYENGFVTRMYYDKAFKMPRVLTFLYKNTMYNLVAVYSQNNELEHFYLDYSPFYHSNFEEVHTLQDLQNLLQKIHLH